MSAIGASHGLAALDRTAANECVLVHPVKVSEPNSSLPSLDRLVYLMSAELQDDDLPLWEIVWHLNRLAPSASLDDKIRLSRRAVSVLVGHNDLWRGEWPGGPLAPLTQSETQTLASDEAAWHDPEHATLLVWLREEGFTEPDQSG